MLWLQGGLLVATLILGIKTGMVLGTSWLSRRWLVLVSGIFGIGLYGLVLVFDVHQQMLVAFLDRYTFIGSLLMAILLIYLGLQQEPGQGCSPAGQPGEEVVKPGYIQEQKTRFKLSRWKYVMGFLPCPLCLAALSLSVILVSPVVDIPLPALGRNVAICFSGLVMFVAVAIRKVVQLTKFNPVVIFNTVLLFTGILTLTFALTIPNFVQSMAMPLTPLALSSPRLVVMVLLGMSGLGLVGYFRYQISCDVKDCDSQ